MFEPQRILCPVDFSSQSGAALRVAGGLARIFGAELTVAHARQIEVPLYFTKAQVGMLKAQMRRSAKASRAYLEDFAVQYVPAGLAYSSLVLDGDPVAGILKTVQETRPGLLVMGTHGRTGLARIRMGSVADSVLRQASLPVLSVGPHVPASVTRGSVRRVICPVNYSNLARQALNHAAAIAEKAGAELLVTRVLEDPAQAEDAGKERETLCGWLPSEMRDRCALREVVRTGHAAEQILFEAKKSKADLLVIGAQRRSFLGSLLFGSTTESVIRGASAPVLSVIAKEPK
jgi:nucleotide-binding universal stress UspA family protein